MVMMMILMIHDDDCAFDHICMRSINILKTLLIMMMMMIHDDSILLVWVLIIWVSRAI